MKKVLFATTALIASAGIAAADGHASVTVGGYGFAGVKDTGVAGTSTDVISKIRLTFSASVETDAGVTFSASTRMNISNNVQNVEANALERGKVSLAANGFSVAVGATNGAMRSLGRQATFYGFDDGGTLGFDNSDGGGNADFTRQADAGNNIYAAYTTGGLTFGISTDVDGASTEIGVKYVVGAFTLNLAGNDQDDVMIGAAYNSDTIDVEIGANSADTVYLGLSYDVSPAFEISAAVQDADDGQDVGLQGSYDLGGASLVGTVGENAAGNSVASLGVIFSF